MERSDKDIFVISDLHLGDASLRDKFEAGHKTKQLHAFLDYVGSVDGELFILGDLFELWQMNMSLMLVRRRELLDHIAELNFVFVPGNHDVDLVHFIDTDFLEHPFFKRMRAPFIRELGGKRYRFAHGHECDPFNSGDDPGFGRMLAIFAGVFEDQSGSPFLATGEGVGDVLEQFGESMLTIWKTAAVAMKDRRKDSANSVERPNAALTPAQDPDRLAEHVAGVRADLEKIGYDVAILGHTHKVGRVGDWYFNDGSWIGSSNPFLRISPAGEVRHFEWKDNRAIERAMPVVLADATQEPATKNPFGTAISAAKRLFPRPTKPERSRWILIIQGALALALGVATLTVTAGQGASAGWRLLASAFGAYALLDGALSLLGATREQPVKRLLSRIRGVASVLLGVVVLRRAYVVEVFAILVGISAFIGGALRFAASVVFNRMVDSKWLLVVSAGSMIAGLILLLFPTSTVLLKFVLCGYLCYYGFGELLAGIFGQRLSRAQPRAPSGVLQ